MPALERATAIADHAAFVASLVDDSKDLGRRVHRRGGGGGGDENKGGGEGGDDDGDDDTSGDGGGGGGGADMISLPVGASASASSSWSSSSGGQDPDPPGKRNVAFAAFLTSFLAQLRALDKVGDVLVFPGRLF